MPLWQQALVVGGTAAVLTLGGLGWGAAFAIASGFSTVAAHGQGIATLIQDPRRATRDFVRTLTPADAAALAVNAVLSRVLPAAIGSTLGRTGHAAVEDVFKDVATPISTPPLPKPMVESTKLLNIVNNLYRGTTTEAFVRDLADAFPEVRLLLEEHLQDNFGEVLPHLLLADVARLTVLLYRQSMESQKAADTLDALLSYIERAFVDGNDEVRELISVSFVENLPSSVEADAGLRTLLGPALSDEFSQVNF